MIRLLFLRLWPAFLPLIVYWLWLRYVGRKATIDGKPALRFRDGPWYWAVLASLLTAMGCLTLLGLSQPQQKGDYTPAHVEEGTIIPGNSEQAMTQVQPEWLGWNETQKLIAAFGAEKVPLRFVGGAVRDALLKREVKDVDAATPLKPEAVITLLEKAHIRAIPTGIAHGTVTALIDKKPFEITTLRRDVATDGRHATVAYTDNWQEDAARRDFTLNALYLSPEGELFDYFSGETDAKLGKIRFIGDAISRIREDYLRILRFFRFHAWFGQGDADAAGLSACASDANKLSTLSGERIQQELFKLLSAPHASATLRTMQHARVLDHALGIAIGSMHGVEKLEEQANVAPIVKLAALLDSSMNFAGLQQRLKLSSADAELLQELMHEYRNITADAPLGEQKKLLRLYGPELFTQLVQLGKAHADAPHAFDSMLKLADQWQPPVFPLSGDDLIAEGFTPGKELGALLQGLEDWWEESDYAPGKAALLARAKQAHA